MQSCFAACSQVVCVAEDTAVAFYAAKSLRKFRVERLNGSRVCGVHVEVLSHAKAVLHVIDAEATWFQFAIEGGAPSLTRTSAIRLHTLASTATTTTATTPSAAAAATASPSPAKAGAEEDAPTKPAAVPQGSASSPADAEAPATSSAAAAAAVVVAAHFHVQQAQLYAVLLTRAGVYEAALRGSAMGAASAASTTAVLVHAFESAVPHAYLSVGVATGLIAVAVPHSRDFFFSLFTDRLAAHQPHHPPCPPLQPRAVTVQVQSIACSPTSTSVAVGGSRGELLVFVEVQEAHCFADHWHHTPLTALAFAVDGSAVYTGGREGVLLIWDLVSYNHRKLKVQLGTLQAVTPFTDAGAHLLLSCGTSTLAVADLLQRRVTVSAEGIEWAAEDVCTGLLVEQWRGSPAVILTGMPNVLRVCDPYTQQSLYSLHVSAQMETLASPPRHGIQFVGLLNDSRSLVTYEAFTATALPPLLRFWEYDAQRKQHVETQTVYSPHRSAVVALEVDKRGRRVFTLSREAIKCWAQTAFTAQDAYGTPAGGWHNHSTMPTPSQQVCAMAFSADGARCLVADDCVHVYGVASCRPGERWPLLRLLPQYAETAPLRQLVVAGAEGRHVVAAGRQRLFFWAMAGGAGDAEPVTFSTGPSTVTALCALTDTTVVAALEDTTLIELRCAPTANGSGRGEALGEVLRRVPHASRYPLRHLAALQANTDRLAAVDAVTGFKVLQLPTASAAVTESASVVTWTGSRGEGREGEGDSTAVGAGAGASSGATAQLQLQSFFKDMTSLQEAQQAADGSHLEGALTTAQQTAQADRWLAEVLGEPAYTVPPMSAILSTYLQRQP